MTNAEKYEEVFGLPPLTHNCITEKPCPDCPIYNGLMWSNLNHRTWGYCATVYDHNRVVYV